MFSKDTLQFLEDLKATTTASGFSPTKNDTSNTGKITSVDC
jgi:hypothetical protein